MCENGMREEWIERQMKKTSTGKEIEIIHIIFLVIAMYCQASSSQINELLNLPRC